MDYLAGSYHFGYNKLETAIWKMLNSTAGNYVVYREGNEGCMAKINRKVELCRKVRYNNSADTNTFYKSRTQVTIFHAGDRWMPAKLFYKLKQRFR